MRNTFYLGLTASLFLAKALSLQSCGASQAVGEDILRVGGISSTGNKEDEDTNAPEAKGDEGTYQPAPASLDCKSTADMSNLRYELANAQKTRACQTDEFSADCLEVLTFQTKEQGTAYLRIDGGVLKAVEYGYRSCEEKLFVWVKDADKSAVLTAYQFSEDRAVLTNKENGLEYHLVP